MVFNSVAYAVFLPTVLALYYVLNLRGQNVLLLLASYLFYGWWDWRFLSLLWASTVIDYVVGLLLDHPAAIAENVTARRIEYPDRAPPAALPRPLRSFHRLTAPLARRRRGVLLLSIIVNLGLLGFFKYFNFFVTSAGGVLTAMGVRANLPTLQILLPVGISFFTFQSLSYTIDVYRGKIRAVRNPLHYALFVAYFPQHPTGQAVFTQKLTRDLTPLLVAANDAG